jgi:anti-sigma regulatory factor (Ser/Thr protein kinase)
MPPADTGRDVARLTIRSDARELRAVRQRLKEFFAAHEIPPALCEDLILVINELTTNAIEASALGSDITVEVRIDGSHITVAVDNVGPPFTLPPKVELPDSARLRGRGLALTSRIVDHLSTEPLVDGTRVIARCSR